MRVDVRELRPGDQNALGAVQGGNGWNSDPAMWARYLADHRSGRRTVLLAWMEERPVGYVNLAWQSDYGPFLANDIPEIDNLGVDVVHRRQGVATSLILSLEEAARQAGRREIGIGVGLFAHYGDAQRLYWRLGYKPDGRGVTYAGQKVLPGENVRLDDNLILWLSKSL